MKSLVLLTCLAAIVAGPATAQDTTVAAPPETPEVAVSPSQVPAPAQKPHGITFGAWEGQRGLGVITSFFTISALEGGGYINWEATENLAIRFQGSYLKSSESYSTTSSYSTSEGSTVLSGYPLQVYVLPTVEIGERILIRAGGGLSLYMLKIEQTSTYSTEYYTSIYSSKYDLDGKGGQFLVALEGRITPMVGVEVQYERGTAKFSFKRTLSDGSTQEEEYGLDPEAYRVGLAFHF